MDARTRAIVLAILIGSVLIAAAIYFPAAAGLQEIDANPCLSSPHPDNCTGF